MTEQVQTALETQGAVNMEFFYWMSIAIMMLIHAGLGEKDEAFKWAERMFEEQDFVVLGLKVNPVFDSLRPDPRYALLLRRAKLA